MMARVSLGLTATVLSVAMIAAGEPDEPMGNGSPGAGAIEAHDAGLVLVRQSTDQVEAQRAQPAKSEARPGQPITDGSGTGGTPLPGETGGIDRPAGAPVEAETTTATEFRIAFWYRRADPSGSLRHQVYDVRGGRYDSRAVSEWLDTMRSDFPSYVAYLKDIRLDGREELATVIERERARIQRSGRTKGPVRRSGARSGGHRPEASSAMSPRGYPPHLFPSRHSVSAPGFSIGPPSGGGLPIGSPSRSSYAPNSPRSPSSPFPYPYPRPHP
jgi:hypothetical protein